MRGIFGALTAMAATALSACTGTQQAAQTTTVTVVSTETVTAAPPTPTNALTSTAAAPPSSTVNYSDLYPASTSYSGTDRVFAVGEPRGGLTAAIPPGRYSVSINDGQSGTWMRCSSELCGLAYMENVIAIENAMGPDYSAVMQVEPSDAAIKLIGITLTPVT